MGAGNFLKNKLQIGKIERGFHRPRDQFGVLLQWLDLNSAPCLRA